MSGRLFVWNRSDASQRSARRGLCLVATLLLAACSSVPGEIAKTPPTVDPGSVTANGNPLQPADKKPQQTASKPLYAETPASAEQVSDQVIYFAQGDAALSEESREKLKQAALYLKQNPKRLVTLMTFSESLGSRTFTLAIMDNRLNVVAAALHEFGVAKSRIRKTLISQKGPKGICTTLACRSSGPRVELRYK